MRARVRKKHQEYIVHGKNQVITTKEMYIAVIIQHR
jgi:hypothetical protein